MMRTLFLIACLLAAPAAAQDLTVIDLSHQVHAVTTVQLAAMPRTTVSAKARNGQVHVFSGPSLAAILKLADAPSGANLKGKDMADVVLVSARDGYRVVLSLAETDPSLADGKILLADQMDGKAIGPEDVPLRLIVPGDARPVRWARMVERIEIIRLP